MCYNHIDLNFWLDQKYAAQNLQPGLSQVMQEPGIYFKHLRMPWIKKQGMLEREI